MKSCRNNNLGQYYFPKCFSCRDGNGYFTSGFPQKTGTSRTRYLNKKIYKKNLPVSLLWESRF